ncbi:MAG: hypothetical protein AAF449_06925, partial [Myxococcota bacterium]
MTSSAVAAKAQLDVWAPARLFSRGVKVYRYTREVEERAAQFRKGPDLLHQRAQLLQEMCSNAMKLHGMEMVVHGSLPKPPY